MQDTPQSSLQEAIDNSSTSQQQQPTITANHVKFFAGDLSFFCTEKDLHMLFSPFGHVQSIHIPRTAAHGESLMHGFVHLEPSPQFTPGQIVEALNGREYRGRHLCVQISLHNGQRNPISKDHLIQVHMSFISKQAAYIVDEAVLRGIFAAFGEVADISIKKHAFMMPQNFQSGYGFVYFYDVSSAQFVVSALKGKTVDDVTIDCSMSFRTDILMSQRQRDLRSYHSDYSQSNRHGPYSVQAMTLAKGEEARRFKKQHHQQQQQFHHNRNYNHQPQHRAQFEDNDYHHQYPSPPLTAYPHRSGPSSHRSNRHFYGEMGNNAGYQYHLSQGDFQQQQQQQQYLRGNSDRHIQNQSYQRHPLFPPAAPDRHFAHRDAAATAAVVAPSLLGELDDNKFLSHERGFVNDVYELPAPHITHYTQPVAPGIVDEFFNSTNSSPPLDWSNSLYSPTFKANERQQQDRYRFSSDLFAASAALLDHSSSSASGTTEESAVAWGESFSNDGGFDGFHFIGQAQLQQRCPSFLSNNTVAISRPNNSSPMDDFDVAVSYHQVEEKQEKARRSPVVLLEQAEERQQPEESQSFLRN